MTGRAIRVLGAAALLLHPATPAFAQGTNLVANPLLARDLPPPGWLATHREQWVAQHPIYRATCESAEVVKEIRFLNRLIAYDEYMLSLATTPDPDNPSAKEVAQVARQSTELLRRDVLVGDALVAQLQLLPPCDTGTPTQPVAASAMPPTLPTARDEAAPAPAPSPHAAPAEAKATPPPATSPGVISAAPPPPDRLVIRFDDRVAALTPSGIHAFNQAVAAARAGKPVRLAIDGCETGADFARGSPCARRLYSLENRLEEAGVKNPERLFDSAR